LLKDGYSLKTNKLLKETSPYLLQHANNPVNWYPWGNEAFSKAKTENKPIFLSIGYSTCHWCHVMEKESFMDEEVARLLNQYFISIKVDREERPDIDSIYMQACIKLNGHGGWPLSAFLTPDQKPFYTGTYFPKNTNHHHSGFIDILLKIKEVWENNKQGILDQAENIFRGVFLKGKNLKQNKTDIVDKTFDYLSKNYDKEFGGFTPAPKFPSPHNIFFLLDYYLAINEKEALKMSEKSLDAMYRGGIFDHIGYGFSRYSTDRYWLVPHFEKMLYDNALLISAYSKAYALTKNKLYSEVIEKTVIFLIRDLMHPEGAFYSALDADSDGEEGKFYLLSYQEILDVLGEKDGKLYIEHFNITKKGNFEGRNIPNLINTQDLTKEFDSEKLYNYRKNRESLHCDDKILTSWNCLMIAALAESSIIFKRKDYLKLAKNAFVFLEKELFKENKIYASYREEKISEFGFLDDYAFWIFACIWLYKATFLDEYLLKAKNITNIVINNFRDSEGGFFLNDESNKSLFWRSKETHDGAIPSGNSVMAFNLHFLSVYFEESDLTETSERHFLFMENEATRYLGGNSFLALAVLKSRNFSKVICILKDDSLEEYKDVLEKYDIVKVLKNETKFYKVINNKTTFYICKGSKCLPPSNTLSKFNNSLV